MAKKHKYINSSVGLFDDEDSISDINMEKSNSKRDSKGQILMQQEDVLRKTLEASNRALGLIQETEDMGIETARKLEHQGQQLKNTNANLDKIKADLEVSQRNINGMKSIFKRAKYYFKGKAKKLGKKLKNTPEIDGKPLEPIKIESYQVRNEFKDTSTQHFDLTGTNKDLNDMVEENTIQILNSVVKLKDIAVSLGKEIEEQDKVLDAIQEKVERCDIKIGHQTNQMNELLK